MVSRNKSSEQKNEMVKKIIMLSGLVFIILGFYANLNTQAVSELIGFDTETAQIFSYCLIIVGISDFIIATFLFRTKDRV